MDPQLKCSFCEKNYTSKNVFQLHLQIKHADQFRETSSKELYTCKHCLKNYNDSFSLTAHLRKDHKCGLGEEKNDPTPTCPLCAEDITDDIKLHFKTDHDIKIEERELNFNNFDDFLQWKVAYEKESKSRFVMERGVNRSENCSKYYFVCRRPERRTRRIETQRNKKIQGDCPAKIWVFESNTGSCKVRVCKTHVGHSNSSFFSQFYLTESDGQILSVIIRRHQTSLMLPTETIVKTESGYIVPSASNLNETYLVKETDLSCQCKLSCTECSNVCIHQYSCTCIDGSVKLNMCKHIHLVCRLKGLVCEPSHTNNEEGSSTDENVIGEEAEMSEYYKMHGSYSFSEKKDEIKKKFLAVLDLASDEDDLRIIDSVVKSIPFRLTETH